MSNKEKRAIGQPRFVLPSFSIVSRVFKAFDLTPHGVILAPLGGILVIVFFLQNVGLQQQQQQKTGDKTV